MLGAANAGLRPIELRLLPAQIRNTKRIPNEEMVA